MAILALEWLFCRSPSLLEIVLVDYLHEGQQHSAKEVQHNLYIDLHYNVSTGVFLPKINPPNTNPEIKLLSGRSPQSLDNIRHEALYENTNSPRFTACYSPSLTIFLISCFETDLNSSIMTKECTSRTFPP